MDVAEYYRVKVNTTHAGTAVTSSGIAVAAYTPGTLVYDMYCTRHCCCCVYAWYMSLRLVLHKVPGTCAMVCYLHQARYMQFS